MTLPEKATGLVAYAAGDVRVERLDVTAQDQIDALRAQVASLVRRLDQQSKVSAPPSAS